MSHSSNNPTIPLIPESIQDLAWGLSLYFSNDKKEQKFGEDVKDKWDKLAERYEDDIEALNYLDNVNAVMSSTIYTLAQIRQQARDQFEFLDDLKRRRIKDLDDLASLSKNAESIATRIAGISLGGGGISFIGSLTNVLGTHGIVWFIVGAGIAYFALEFLLRRYRNKKVPEIMKQTQEKKEEFLTKQVKRNSEEALKELLTKVGKIAERFYGSTYTITTETITNLTSSTTTVTSGSFLTGGTIPPTYYTPDKNNE